ncbi:MAG TPA: peptidylprolyl isomerase [Vicinamibacteria bacterium]|nr:peptidylprolyl isomerase [Vicinamibacteria bacterium]
MWDVFSPLWMFSSALLVQAQPAQPTTTPTEFPEIVAKVNGTEIKREALVNRAEALKGQIPAQQIGADFYQRVLNDMVEGELLYQSVEKKGLAPTPQEIEAELESQKGRFGGEAGLGKALESQGLTLDDLKLELKKEIGIQKLIESEFVPTISVTPEEKRKFYDENTAQMQRPEQFRAAHILILVQEGSTPEVKEEARKKAGAIRSLLDAGQDFAELARKNSEDPGSKDSGGDLPWMSPGQTVPPFETAAMALSPGQLSPVVETDFGFHIIKLHEKRSAGLMPYEEVEGRIDEFLKRRSLQQKLESEIQNLRTQAKVEVFI